MFDYDLWRYFYFIELLFHRCIDLRVEEYAEKEVEIPLPCTYQEEDKPSLRTFQHRQPRIGIHPKSFFSSLNGHL